MLTGNAVVTVSALKTSRLVIALTVLLLVGIFFWLAPDPLKTAKINNTTLKVEIADDIRSRQQGLSGRKTLAKNHGMLFVFDQLGNACMWMKDMNFNIDILWFDQNFILTHHVANLSPESYPHNYCAPKNSKYVLEVPAGTIDEIDPEISKTILRYH